MQNPLTHEAKASVNPMLRLGVVAAIGLAAIGCNNQETAEAQTAAPAAPVAPPAGIAVSPVNDPSEILASFGETKLTRGDIEQEVTMRMASMRERVPAERLTEFREGLTKYTLEQFIVRQLLLNEAKRRAIEVTEEDREEAYSQIRATLPEGKTLEDAMKASPLGEARMREEIEAGLQITKLMDTEMGEAVEISAEELAAFRAENADQLNLPEKVKASHILISLDAADTDEAKAEKKAKADDIRQKLVDGGDFAALAAEHSSCPSKARGGDLGLFGRGQMVGEFETAAFAQDVDAIGEVVATKFGYHIIKVTQHDKAGEVSDEEVKETLESQKQRDVATALIAKLKEAANVTYTEGFEPPAAR